MAQASSGTTIIQNSRGLPVMVDHRGSQPAYSNLQRFSSSQPPPPELADSATSQSRWWEHRLFHRLLLFGCMVFGLLVVVAIIFSISLSSNTSVASTMLPIKPKEVSQLFEPPLVKKTDVTLYNQKSSDTTFRMMDGVLFDENNSAIRIFDLGTDFTEMDMISLVLYTCCCNDKLIVVCDNSRPTTSKSVALLQTAEEKSISLDDYAISCYLSHDPSTPYANTETIKYKHNWKLIIQFGRAFEKTGPTNTDCIFSATYYTSYRHPPPPPKIPNNDVTGKVW